MQVMNVRAMKHNVGPIQVILLPGSLCCTACSSATMAATGLASGRVTGDPATPLAVAVL